MDAQLHLLITDPGDPADGGWRLDEGTRARGLRGVAKARSALAEAARHRAASGSDAPAEGDRHPHPSAA
jgi:hypothetical protein